MARRRNPYTAPRPDDWSSMTKLQRGAWNRSHWSKDGVSAPLSFEKRAAARRYRMSLGMDNPRVSFKTCHGKKVSFKARTKRRGRVPKHLKPYLYRKGHKPTNRCGKRRSRR